MMVDSFVNNINKYVKDNHKVILSISGGVDSIVLLDLLFKTKLNLNILLVHINYNLHNHCLEAEKLIVELSKKYNCKLKLFNQNIPSNNFENNARNSRYNLLYKVCNKFNADFILTAHHFNDQIETLIMNDNKKASWVNYLGIRKKYGKIFRPLLFVGKKDILSYAYKNNLKWIEDNTNKLNICKRNMIRIDLEKGLYNKSYIDSLLDKHDNSKKNIKCFYKNYNKYKKLITTYSDGVSLLIKDFLYINDKYKKLFLKKILDQCFNLKIQLSQKHFSSFISFINKSKQGSLFKLSKNIDILKDRKNIFIYNNDIVKCNDKQLTNNISWYDSIFSIVGVNDRLDDSDFLDCIFCPKNIINKGIYITHWNAGDSIINNNINKKISDIFINNKISNIRKKTYPIIRKYDGEILWIPGLIKNVNYNYNEENKKIIWQRKKN